MDPASAMQPGHAVTREEQPMDTEELRARIASFPRWHYQFDLQGVKTPIFDPGHINRHEQRVKYFFDPLVDLFDGSLKGKRVLDLGCNAGFWSLKAIEAGCDFVLGIDGRQMHIDQANLVFEANQVDQSRYEFRTGNIFVDEFSDAGPFDVVLCLGLMYHISKPVELLERIVAVNTDVLVIDTSVSGMGGSSIRFRRDALDEPRNSVDHEMVFILSKQAIVDLVRSFGYSVIPLSLHATNFDGMLVYQRGTRLAFMCAKKTDLSALAAVATDEPFAKLEKMTQKMFRGARAGLSMARLSARLWSDRRRGNGPAGIDARLSR
jgi:2-polyprenyl-3-methyl-5-hydroxy-6-metoxy-1,4-benzoquinol methylase